MAKKKQVAYKPTSDFIPKLDTPIVVQQKEDLFERLIKYGRIIVESSTANGNNTIAYTVPAGKSFFLISCVIAGATGTGLIGQDSMDCYISFGSLLQPIGEIQFVDGSHVSSVNCIGGSPLILKSGQEIRISSASVQTFASVSLSGYEIDTEFLK